MELIGRKVKGFKFDETEDLGYLTGMNEYIGEVGEIVYYDKSDNSYKIQFEDDYWYYPADEIQAHLVDEWVVGQDYEFRGDEDEEWKKGKLLGIIDYEYKYIAKMPHLNFLVSSKHIRHIEQPNKEILDQIAVLEKELSNLKSKIK